MKSTFGYQWSSTSNLAARYPTAARESLTKKSPSTTRGTWEEFKLIQYYLFFVFLELPF